MGNRVNDFMNFLYTVEDRVNTLERTIGNPSGLPYYYRGIIDELEELRKTVDNMKCGLDDIRNMG